VTTFEYDESGRMSRAVTVREPEFSAWDRAMFLDLWSRDKEPRGSHGWTIADATNPENQFKFYVPPPTKDFAAEALHREQELYHKRYPSVDMGSVLWRVEKKG
jgi:hypothetical protein